MLDPQIQPLVDAINLAAADAPPNPTLDDRRQAYLALSTVAGPGPQLDHVEDSVVPGPGGDIPVRIYRNEGARGIFVYYHGGGFTIGDLDTHDEVCRQLAKQSNSTVMAVHYRLAPEAPFPAAVEDAWAALRWADLHRAELGGSAKSKIVVGGDSAGGNLSAVVALMARDANLDLAAQLLVYPGTENDDTSPSMSENANGYILDKDTVDWFMAQYDADVSDWRASPARAESHEGLAAALVITAQYDPLRDQGAEYAKTLEAGGVPVTYTNYEGMVHIFFQLGPIADAAARSVTEVSDFAKAALS
ncbi:MAG: alpha/beta hydrolase [Actinobacteria bacterium]|nr:alpha/beta hydrolase [Actinomycetota bacterium]